MAPAVRNNGVIVVARYLGCLVDNPCLLRQPRDGFEPRAQLDPVEGLLDSPVMLVETCEQRGQENRRALVGGNHSGMANRCELANKTCPDRLRWATPAAEAIRLGCLDRHPGLSGAGLLKIPAQLPIAVNVTTHDPADAAR